MITAFSISGAACIFHHRMLGCLLEGRSPTPDTTPSPHAVILVEAKSMSDLNDPRVFFAAERTLLAWNRTSLTLLAFGFVIDRFVLFVPLLSPCTVPYIDRGFSYWIGIAFILLVAVAAAAAMLQYRAVLRTLRPGEIPQGYRGKLGLYVNVVVALLGLAITAYFFTHGPAF